MIYKKTDYSQKKKNIFPPELTIPYNVLKANDSILYGLSTSGKGRFFAFNTKSYKYELAVSDIPFTGSRSANEMETGQIMYSIMDYNSTHKKIICAMRFFDQIDIFNSYDLSVHNTIKNSNSEPYKYTENLIVDETMFYYVDVFSTDNYIYALYCGKPYSEAIANTGHEICI